MTKTEHKNIREGEGSEHSPLYDDIIQNDAQSLRNPILSRGNYLPGTTSVPYFVYFDKDFAHKELVHVWKKSWQFACREEEIPNSDDERLKLKEASVETWQGCVFINPDPRAAALKDALGVLDEHFKNFDMENRFIAMHTRKKVRANWKLTMEAFLETYHVMEKIEQ